MKVHRALLERAWPYVDHRFVLTTSSGEPPDATNLVKSHFKPVLERARLPRPSLVRLASYGSNASTSQWGASESGIGDARACIDHAHDGYVFSRHPGHAGGVSCSARRALVFLNDPTDSSILRHVLLNHIQESCFPPPESPLATGVRCLYLCPIR